MDRGPRSLPRAGVRPGRCSPPTTAVVVAEAGWTARVDEEPLASVPEALASPLPKIPPSAPLRPSKAADEGEELSMAFAFEIIPW